MKQNEQELQFLKNELREMWRLVISQVEKSRTALLRQDTQAAAEVIVFEDKVDAFDLKIDSLCEHYIALYNPVAIDLRMVLSSMKISLTLERIADYVASIAHSVAEEECNDFYKEMNNSLEVKEIYTIIAGMLTDTLVIFETESAKNAGRILIRDKQINKLYKQAFALISTSVEGQNSGKIECGLKMMLILQKLERIGDHCTNIVEELVFYTEAKTLKHKS